MSDYNSLWRQREDRADVAQRHDAELARYEPLSLPFSLPLS